MIISIFVTGLKYMCCGILKAFGGLGAIVALILVVVALLKQLIAARRFPAYGVKVAIVVVFVAVLVMIVLAIFRDRSRKTQRRDLKLDRFNTVL